MKTDTVEIRYNRFDEKYRVSYKHSDLERVDHTPIPSKMGFYHFHRKIGPKKAFNELKHFLTEIAYQEIAQLQ